SGSGLGTLQEEAICAICLDYFLEPVSIGCGHNFCRVCISQLWGGEAEYEAQTFTCPQCRKTFFERNFRPNLQLANMVQIIRQLHPYPPRLAPPAAGPSASGACGRREPLKLFCEVDEQAICVVCRESRSHKHHSVVPLEEVVQDYKVGKRGIGTPKTNPPAPLNPFHPSPLALQDKMKLEIKELESDFELLHQFLIGEQVLLLHQLEERYESLLVRQSSNISQLEEQSAALSRLIAEAEDKSKQDGLQLTHRGRLQISIQPIKHADEDLGVGETGVATFPLNPPPFSPFFFFLADITLDPDTAHPRLSLSLDRRSVKLGERCKDLPDNPKRFDSDYCVLGSQGFTAGRHYWEVEVGGRRGWAVGAARETARRKEKTMGPHQEREIWCVGTNGKKYQALTATEQTALSPNERPRRFGVYLDYERGQICFYNAESMTHIHTFNASFHERIFPFFRILAKGTRIKICA
uniref:RING-type E3 ubiquitin transferase n=1 Tax=Anas platyrhynchos TaxID=8839 RepID=A0A8B9ZFG9_ANAPL